jgi:hypothetical protein
MLDIFRRKRTQDNPRTREVIPDPMGYPRSDFSRYDPFGEERWSPERKSIHALEGAGRKGWDYDQNRGYGLVYGQTTPGRQERNNQGKGPRNYHRPDERILEDIYNRIAADWNLDAIDVDIKVDAGVVHLAGQVRDRTVRHRIEDITEAVRGVKSIENKIRIEK